MRVACSSVDPDRGVDPGAGKGGHHGACDITLLEGPNAGAGRGDLRHDLLMSRAVQDHDGEVLDASVAREGDASKVVGDRIVQVDRASRSRSGHHLLDVPDRRKLGETARLDGGDDRQRVGRASCDLARPFDWEHAEVEAALARRQRGAGGKV